MAEFCLISPEILHPNPGLTDEARDIHHLIIEKFLEVLRPDS